MAYLSGFEFDIFISYAHVDNVRSIQGDKGWVDIFHQELEICLGQRFGRLGLVKVWRDLELGDNQLFNKVIAEKIDQSALFITLHSWGYKASNYCKKELSHFYQKASEEHYGPSVGDYHRIINVLLNKVPRKEWGDEFAGRTAFEFFDPEDNQWPINVQDRAFLGQVRSLVSAIYDTLQSFKEIPVLAETSIGEVNPVKVLSPVTAVVSDVEVISDVITEEPAPDDNFKVFIGSVSDPLKSTKKKIVQSLKQEGIEIVGGVPPLMNLTGMTRP